MPFLGHVRLPNIPGHPIRTHTTSERLLGEEEPLTKSTDLLRMVVLYHLWHNPYASNRIHVAQHVREGLTRDRYSIGTCLGTHIRRKDTHKNQRPLLVTSGDGKTTSRFL